MLVVKCNWICISVRRMMIQLTDTWWHSFRENVFNWPDSETLPILTMQNISTNRVYVHLAEQDMSNSNYKCSAMEWSVQTALISRIPVLPAVWKHFLIASWRAVNTSYMLVQIWWTVLWFSNIIAHSPLIRCFSNC